MSVTVEPTVYYTQTDLMKMFSVGHKAIAKMQAEGLKSKKMGTKVFYKGSDIEEHFDKTKI